MQPNLNRPSPELGSVRRSDGVLSSVVPVVTHATRLTSNSRDETLLTAQNRPNISRQVVTRIVSTGYLTIRSLVNRAKGVAGVREVYLGKARQLYWNTEMFQ